MVRLFVAIELDPATADAVAALAPEPLPAGIRAVPRDQLHLTLHFLGEADPEQVRTALAGVRAAPFPLALAGVGRFKSPRGSALWVGVRPHAGLTALHTAVADALAPTGFVPESRPFSPHLTIARAKTTADRTAIGQLLAAHRDFAPPPVEVRRFVLFSSLLRAGGPLYTAEATYPLGA